MTGNGEALASPGTCQQDQWPHLAGAGPLRTSTAGLTSDLHILMQETPPAPPPHHGDSVVLNFSLSLLFCPLSKPPTRFQALFPQSMHGAERQRVSSCLRYNHSWAFPDRVQTSWIPDSGPLGPSAPSHSLPYILFPLPLCVFFSGLRPAVPMVWAPGEEPAVLPGHPAHSPPTSQSPEPRHVGFHTYQALNSLRSAERHSLLTGRELAPPPF